MVSKRNEAKIIQKMFCFEAKKTVFLPASLWSKTVEITSQTKTKEAKKQNETIALAPMFKLSSPNKMTLNEAWLPSAWGP
jgi:hypothetical protein